jgi:hypothetical protein
VKGRRGASGRVKAVRARKKGHECTSEVAEGLRVVT